MSNLPRSPKEAATIKAWKLARRAAKKRKKVGKSANKESYPCEAQIRALGAAMTKPHFSFIAAAHRKYAYGSVFSSLSANAHIKFEVVFVGPSPPVEQMPGNFKYIQTDAKPAECLEIAARNSVGNYLVVGSDNLMFSDFFLNKLYTYTLRLSNYEVVIGSRIRTAGNVFLDESLVFDENVPNCPVVVMTPTLKKELWTNLGGIDNRFNSCCCSDIDIQMRCYENGMTQFLIPDCSIERIKYPQDAPEVFSSDRKFLNSLWVKEDGTMSKQRLSPVEKFSM